MTIRSSIRGDRIAGDLRDYPERVVRLMDNAARRGAVEIAREARANAPKAQSTLASSISVRRLAPGVHQVIVGADYGVFVEEGTEPGGFPPQRSIEDWLGVRNIEPNDPRMTREDLAFVIARSIARHGTPAQPFFDPAVEDQRERVVRLLNAAADEALAR